MTYEQIETFLAAVAKGSVTGAAEALYVSQSTASSRIQLLERELGAELLIRGKGQRGVELTAYGRSFVPIANQWASLWKDTQALHRRAGVTELSIASVDAVNNFTLLPLYNMYVDERPEVKLRISTHHSNEIHSLVENRSADIGFVYRQIQYPNIVSRPVYRELMYLLCRTDSPYYDGIAPEELPAEKEIFLSWGPDYRIWHDRHWSPEAHHLLEVNTGSMLRHYLTRPDRWAIAPMAVVQQMRADRALTYHTLSVSPPPRICYEVITRYPRASRVAAIDLFRRDLEKFISEASDICAIQPWMLDTFS